jgi:uncharacterized membrane protein
MEAYFVEFASFAALLTEGIVVLVLVLAALQALVRSVVRGARGLRSGGARAEIWLDFSAWIVLALTFALAADIIRSAIAPSWDAIGKLGAIAAIRTVLNLFLMRDLEMIVEKKAAIKSGPEHD